MRALRGFTLMEVLIAIVILAIAFTALFKSMSTNAKNLLYLQDKSAANWVALNVIGELQLGLLKPASQSNKTELLNHVWYWNAKLFETANASIQRVVVTVKPTENAKSIWTVEGFLRK